MDKLEKEIRDESLRFVKLNRGLKLNPKSPDYLSPRISSEFMDCSMPMTFDHYSHCSLGCSYCFAYMFKTRNLSFTNKLHSVNLKKFERTITGNPKNIREKAIYKHFYKKRFLLHWGGLADPFCNFEKNNNIGYKIIKILAEQKYPTLFSFKGSAIFRPKFIKLFNKYAKNKNFAFQISIIAPSDEMSRKIEIGVPVTSQRIKAIKMLNEMGYYTILRLRPYIIGITDQGIDNLLHRCLEVGIKAVSMEFVALDLRSNANLLKRYEWLGKIIGTKDILKYFKELSPSKRGSYMRLNRLVKEPYVRKIYEFCINNNLVFACSDPDYKELNMSGSCCGMPDKYPENKELQNWTKNQLTYALKEARRQYHVNGRTYKFRFDLVFKSNKDTYLNETELGQDHVAVTGKCVSERKVINYLTIARQVWNNLRSPGNPCNYFHGKMLPIGIDGNQNYIYIYRPNEYESRWIKEGIDLTK